VEREAKLFISPEPGIPSELKNSKKLATNSDNAVWSFLSPARAAAFIELLGKADEKEKLGALASLLNFGLDWQIAEEYICQGLLVSHEEPSWEWFPDPGKDKLDANTLLQEPPAWFRRLSRVESFSGPMLWRDVQTLQEDVLHRSLGWQMPVGEYFSFNTAEKTVTLWQVSSKDPEDHAFKAEQCRHWRLALRMPADWTLVIVYFLDKTKTNHPKVFSYHFRASFIPSS
jgi:hypothetical protein